MIAQSADDCCSTPVQNEERTGKAGVWAAVASVVTAIVASACCWLPLLLLGFGVSAAGVSAAFEKVRPAFLGITAVLLGLGFYLAYFRKEKCAPGTACKVPNPKLKRLNRAMLWIAAVAVLAMAFFPNYVGFFVGTTSAAAVSETPTVSLQIDGMTCEACSLHVKKALEAVPGVQSASVTYSERQAVVAVNPDSQPSAESLVKAIEEAGYKASIESKSGKSK